MERAWKNPNEVMKIRKKKVQKRTSLGLAERCPLGPSLKENSPNGAVTGFPGKKRTPLKDQENSPNLFGAKRKSESPEICTPKAKKRALGLSEVSNNANRTPVRENVVSLGESSFPLDWSLKTKARFTSPHPFTWTSSVKAIHEADGIMSFVRDTSELRADAQSDLQKHLMVWVHPSLPFLKIYPRMDTKQATTPSQASLLQDQQVLQSLKDDWATSFRSIFQLLKSGYCPYFYLCANQFTALFLGEGIGGCTTHTAFLTPTTSGFRQSLKKEGVELTLPLAPNSPRNVESEKTMEESDVEDESAASSWLKSMGLLNDFPGTNTEITFQKSRSVNIDNRPESVVKVEGSSNLHAFFNFLLTSKTTLTTTGAHAGVPPTLLAPVAFEGAALKALKTKQGTIQEHNGDKLTRLHSFDVTGPILPQTMYSLCRLLQKTQHGDFTVHLGCNESTIAFNAGSTSSTGLPTKPRFGPYLSLESSLKKTGLREVSSKDNLFTWN